MTAALPLLRAFGLQRRVCTLSAGGCSAQWVALRTAAHSAAASSSDGGVPRRRGRGQRGASLRAAPELHDALFDQLRQRLCSPTHPLPLRRVYDELADRSRVVDEFHFSNTNRRLARQRLALSFLRRYNVLLHSLLYYADTTLTWNTTSEFSRLALLGESVLVAETRARLLKLFPDIPYAVLVQLLSTVVGPRGLSAAFDCYGMSAIVGKRPPTRRYGGSFTETQKCHMLCAVVGEMYWFAARTRPTEGTQNNAVFPPSDVLILNVLCSHLLECMPAEMIYRVLEPVIADVKSVWVNAPLSVPSQLRLTPRTIGAHSLTTVSLPYPTEEAGGNTSPAVKAAEAQSRRRALTAAAETKAVKSFMRPAINHRNFDTVHYQVLPTDAVMEKPVLASARQPTAAGKGGVFHEQPAHLERVMELARLATRE